MSDAGSSSPPAGSTITPESHVVVTVVEKSDPASEKESSAQVEAFMAPIREVLNSPAVQALVQGVAARMASDASVAQTNANATAALSKLQAENAHILAMEQQRHFSAIEMVRFKAAVWLVVLWTILLGVIFVGGLYALDRKLIEPSSLGAVGVLAGSAWAVLYNKATSKSGAPTPP